MKSEKIKKFKELSKDIESMDLELHIDSISGIEIISIIDVFNEPPAKNENIIGIPSDLSNKDVKRGDVIYITAMVKKKGTSISSPASQAVLKLRVIDIYHGLSYLNKILK